MSSKMLSVRIKMEFMKKAFLSRRFISQKSLFLVCLFFLLALHGTALSQTVTITTQVLIDFEEESGSSQEISFSASPSLIEIEEIAGGIRNFNIEISNNSQESIQLKTIFYDISLSSEGNIKLNEIGTTPYSLTPLLTNKLCENIILTPGEIKKVPFQLIVPPGEKGGRYGAIIFEIIRVILPQGEVYFGLHSETIIYLTILHTEEYKGIIKELLSTNDGKEFKVSLKNSGNIYYQVEGDLIIKNEERSILKSIHFPMDKPSFLFPQDERVFNIFWNSTDSLPEGKYFIEAIIFTTVGNNMQNLDQKEILFEVTPQ